VLSQEPADTSDRAEPIEPTDRVLPTEPTERADPTDPMDSTDPVEPMDRTESCDQRDSREPEPEEKALRHFGDGGSLAMEPSCPPAALCISLRRR
jgi:hypothetical protein